MLLGPMSDGLSRLGAMGSGIALNLAKHLQATNNPNALLVWSRTKSKASEVLSHGHSKFAEGGPAEIASQADIMFLMSFDDHSLVQIVTTASKNAKEGLILVGMATVHPDVTDKIERFKANNLCMQYM
ncbi:hypothetical protein SeLEV6574_g01671 [Synchytrium endobioticum]|nr:hypothetical protein SeLEV6574_g01671 [Synchytrium endobioticum]